MKKEIFAGFLLLLILVGMVLNIRCIKDFTGSIDSLSAQAWEQAAAGDWEGADASAEELERYWHSQRLYTGVFIRHSESGETENMIFAYIGALKNRDTKAAAAQLFLLRESVSDLYEMELPSLASIL